MKGKIDDETVQFDYERDVALRITDDIVGGGVSIYHVDSGKPVTSFSISIGLFDATAFEPVFDVLMVGVDPSEAEAMIKSYAANRNAYEDPTQPFALPISSTLRFKLMPFRDDVDIQSKDVMHYIGPLITYLSFVNDEGDINLGVMHMVVSDKDGRFADDYINSESDLPDSLRDQYPPCFYVA
jgi:hypothetical protein